MSQTQTHLQAPGEKQFFGHPRGLATLFFTEMWERFSYYGLRGLLVLFLTAALADGGFAFADSTAGAILGLYTASVYLLSLPGGWIADRILGQRSAVFWGGVVIAAGHFTMALGSKVLFFVGLCLVAVGTGLLKPNVSAIVGELYSDRGARRDAGFSIFYMGINLGAFLGPIICGYLGENINWHLGFGAAGVGMLAGLIQYRMGDAYLKEAGLLQEDALDKRSGAIRALIAGVAVVTVITVLLWLLNRAGTVNVTIEAIAGGAGVTIVSIAVLYFAYLMAMGGLAADEKKRVTYIFILFIGAAMFWAGFEQAASTLNLFAERLTDRTIGSWEMPTSWLQSVNALFIILLAPVVGSLWVRLDERNPSIPVKFGWGLVLLGVGFFVLAWGASFATPENPVSPMWLVVTYFFHTVGELALSPVGLSSVTKLAPHRLVGQMMGVWFMGTSLGNLIAGMAAGQLESLSPPTLFTTVGAIAAGAGLVYFVFHRPIKHLGPDVK
ncbi:MAG: peptide MFS transporter [Gemmatimonadota bacterium]